MIHACAHQRLLSTDNDAQLQTGCADMHQREKRTSTPYVVHMSAIETHENLMHMHST